MTLALVFFYTFLMIVYYNTGNQFPFLACVSPPDEPEVEESQHQHNFHHKQKTLVYNTYQIDLNVAFFTLSQFRIQEFNFPYYSEPTDSLYLKYLLTKRSRDPPQTSA